MVMSNLLLQRPLHKSKSKDHKSALERRMALRKIPQFYLICWCGKFVERHSFRIALGESPETMPKLCLFTELPHQEIRWNYGILQSLELWELEELVELLKEAETIQKYLKTTNQHQPSTKYRKNSAAKWVVITFITQSNYWWITWKMVFFLWPRKYCNS